MRKVQLNSVSLLLSGMVVLTLFAFAKLVVAPSVSGDKVQTVINGKKLSLELAQTPEQQKTGLSGRGSLAENNGMLFVFNNSTERCFWMRLMRFPLDIIWLDSDKRIVYQKTDVQPSTYPGTFCSDKPAQYVLELNAGTAYRLGLETGQQISF